MTHEEYNRSAQSRAIDGTISSLQGRVDAASIKTDNSSGLADRLLSFIETIGPIDDEQHAPLDTATMSNYGLSEHRYTSSHRLSGGWLVHPECEFEEGATGQSVWQEEGAKDKREELSEGTTAEPARATHKIAVSRHTQTGIDDSYTEGRATKRARITFYDFAAQTRLQQHYERRRRFLDLRKETLQRSTALSARLRRTSSWVQDGLVEISRHQDRPGFTRVFGHIHDLIDVCCSHWNNELQNLDTILSDENATSISDGPPPFFDQLHPQAQNDFLDLLSNLRSNPRFLVDRLSQLPLSQVATLTAKPKWEASEVVFASLSQHSGGSSQRRRRVNQYSKEIEEYATAFERSDPISFLLHNLYSHDASVDAPESRLRLSTWSTVCAELMQSRSESYGSLYWQVLEAFSSMQEWPARQRIELFLMDVLQRGAFLLNENTTQRCKLSLNTGPAHEFFEDAVTGLYWTLIKCKAGCFPTGALGLARAILGKLPNEELQSDFRGHFFHKWFLNHFLKAAVLFPENENMLLQIHISRRARDYILAPLFTRFVSKFENYQDSESDVDESVRYIIMDMINMLQGEAVLDPYQNPPGVHQPSKTAANAPMLVICASEVAKILETLSPQAIYSAHYMSDQVMRDMGSAFQATYSRPSTRFDMLKQALMRLNEPGISSKDIHPCLEAWTQFCVADDGRVTRFPRPDLSDSLVKLSADPELSLAQQGIFRLCMGRRRAGGDSLANDLPHWMPESRLVDLFQIQMDQCEADTTTVEFVYWKKALAQIKRQFPLTALARDDSAALLQPWQFILKVKDISLQKCTTIEEHIGPFEAAFAETKRHIDRFTAGLEELRLKLWYTSEVVNSLPYNNARSIASALSYMHTPVPNSSPNVDKLGRTSYRPSSSRSAASSIFGQPRAEDTVNLLKAPTEHGGPRKLAADQVEAIKQWLQQYNIDNFCKGEERLHRFCMEIWSLSRRLTGETIMESQELWSSELFGRERTYYEYSHGISSAPASTRPASIISEPYSNSATFPSLRPGLRSIDSDVRSTLSDERSSVRRGSVYGLFQRQLNPQLLTPSLASSMSSYGRASSATTNASEIFSLPSQSVTSASVYSRPASIFHGGLPNFAYRPSTSVREKKKFREQLREGLVCLLLSDLGSLIWGRGCETDAWVEVVQKNERVMATFEKRARDESLRNPDQEATTTILRRLSATAAGHGLPSVTQEHPQEPVNAPAAEDEVDYLAALGDTLDRLSQQTDPTAKLQACVDFDQLALQQLEDLSSVSEYPAVTRSRPTVLRRNSTDARIETLTNDLLQPISQLSISGSGKAKDSQIVHHFKSQLAALRPGSLFRDLQYIAAFTPQEMLDNTPAGKAFMHIGMAALEYKRELCNSLVDIADKTVAADAIKLQRVAVKSELHLSKAAEYWKIAALEGNRVAQRELGLLYLVHPEMLPVVTLPLSSTTDIFKDEMMWQSSLGTNDNRQALCLALHWMQQAAEEGDLIAQKKLQERGEGLSLR